MKNLFLILGLSILAISSYAQKAVENRSGFKYEIKAKHQLPEDVKLVNVVVESPMMILTSYEKSENPKNFEEVSNKMKLDTATKYFDILPYPARLVTSNSDHTIKLIVPEAKVFYVAPSINDLNSEDYVFKYNCASKIQLYKNDGTMLLDKEIFGDTVTQGARKVDLFSNAIFKLKINMNKNKPDKQKELIEGAINRAVYFNTVLKAQSILQTECLLYTKSIPVIIFSAKGKADYAELESVVEPLNEAMNKTQAMSSKNAVSVESVKSLFTPAIAVWEKELAQENKTDEKARINASIGNALRYNLALGYFWTGNLNKAKEYIQQVPESDLTKKELVVQNSFTDCAKQLRTAIEQFIEAGERASIADNTKK